MRREFLRGARSLSRTIARLKRISGALIIARHRIDKKKYIKKKTFIKKIKTNFKNNFTFHLKCGHNTF